MKLRKIAAAVSSLVLAAGMASYLPQTAGNQMTASAEASSVNYAEALQKSMFFYEVQQAGILPEWNSVEWRADSMVKENGTPSDVVDGGWFDAGDHYKFTLTNAYSASVLGWGYIQYKDAVDKAGLGEIYRNNLQWGLDYVMACDRGDSMIGTIGDSDDHVVWCSAEVYMRKHKLKVGDEVRPYDTITDTTTVALSAAALAEGYIIFKDSQPEKAEEYLTHAKSLFELANEVRSNEDQGTQKQFYPATTWVDDLMYAANWMYMATGDQSYLDLCETDLIPQFPTENQSSDWKYTWGFCWDDTTQAAALLYAINTGEQKWIDHISHHLEYWGDGYGGKQVTYTPDGLAWLMSWGSNRHSANTAWIALLASDTIFADDAALSAKYTEWAKGQLEYMFGNNDLGLCYVLGMGDLNPTAIHHRTASGIHDDHWNDLGKEESSENWQTEYAHTLYGALVGGPSQTGEYINEVSQYQYSEVAIDYNAGFTAALCAMVDDLGGEILADFPPTETPTWAEWELSATLNGSGNSYTEIKAWAMNHTAWPARVEKNVSYRYYFDVSELLAAGLSIDDVSVRIGSQQYQEGKQGYATISGPHLYEGDASGNTYYVSINFEDARAIQPTGQSEHRCEVQFRISIPDAIDGKPTTGAWDPTNDYSYEGVPDAPNNLLAPEALNDHITMYVNDTLVWGTEPDGTTPKPVEPTTKPVEPDTDPTTEPVEPDTDPTTEPTTDSDVLYGDANCDGAVEIADVVAIMIHLTTPGGTLSAEGKNNADVYQRGDDIGNMDALAVQKSIAQLIKELPESYME